MMYIEAGFTSEMRGILSALKGKTLKSYECNSLGFFHDAVGRFRINLGRYAVDVSLDLHPLDGDPAGFDEMTWFACEEVDLKSEFRPGLVAEPRQYLVNEKITGVELVRDHADHDDGKFVFDCDIALILRTKFRSLVFSRGIWFADEIGIKSIGSYDEPHDLYPIDELWADDNMTVDVSRQTIML